MTKAHTQERTYYCGPACLRIVQEQLNYVHLLTQDQWAHLAGTRADTGTSIAGLKRGIRAMATGFKILRKTETQFPGLAIFHDHFRDHWMVAISSPPWGMVDVIDPWSGITETRAWMHFQRDYLNTVRKSYALLVYP